MAIQIALNHKTQYRYDRLVKLGPQIVRLRPAPHCRTTILSYSLKIHPKKHFLNWQQDPQANYLARLVFTEPTTEFLVEVDLVAEMAIFNPFDFFLEPYAEKYPFTYDDATARDLRPFLETEPLTPALETLALDCLQGIDPHNRFPHRPEPASTGRDRLCDSHGAGRADLRRDTHAAQRFLPRLCLAAGPDLRHLGLGARFVSGYLIQIMPDVKPLEAPPAPRAISPIFTPGPKSILPGAGWVGLDPTSGLLAGEGHIPLACTPDASSAAPISGTLDPCHTTFHHEMSVKRIQESPRVTKPYSEDQWNEILALGNQVDADLKASDVRLTMGGEPTFISLDDANAPEWTTIASGPQKRKLSVELFLRLRDRFAPGALLLFGQGKWYPGEPLPRWALSCYWRKDGVPLWEDQSLFAGEAAAGKYNVERCATLHRSPDPPSRGGPGIHHGGI